MGHRLCCVSAFYSKGDFTMTNHNLTPIFDNSNVTQAYEDAKEFLLEEGLDEDDIPDDVIWDEVGDEEARAWDDDVKYGLIPFHALSERQLHSLFHDDSAYSTPPYVARDLFGITNTPAA